MDFDAFYSNKDMPGVAWRVRGYVETEKEVVVDQYDYCPGHPAEDCGKLTAAIGELVYCEPGCETEIMIDWIPEVDNSRVTAVMVGDDREHEIDVDDLVEIDEDDFCFVCGQIGCGHG